MKNNANTVLITGAAGFIGSNLVTKFLANGYDVVGIDNLNDYYDIDLKKFRMNQSSNEKYIFEKVDICNKESLGDVFKKYNPNIVVNLAAQAGVRYSISNPDEYIKSNIEGFYNILECCRNYSIENLLYASSSSVYGKNDKVPFKETDKVDNPVSLYAATKKSNELMAEVYSNLYNFKAIGLRFFTVYGPAGRPDMAYFSFLEKYFNGEEITIYNNKDLNNDLFRDFTYIDDIVESIYRLSQIKIQSQHEIFNIGNNNPVKLMDFIYTLENVLSLALGKKVDFKKKYENIKPGDVKATYACTKKLEVFTGFKPQTKLNDGLLKFVNWYIDYYNIRSGK